MVGTFKYLRVGGTCIPGYLGNSMVGTFKYLGLEEAP